MAASATCTETRVWISDPSNPTITVLAGTAGNVGGGGQRITAKTKTGEVRTYGNGRKRTVLAADTQRQFTLALIRLTGSQAAQLDTWRDAGTLLLFRDTYGQRVFGTILGTNFYYEPHSALGSPNSDTNGPFVDIGITINESTTPAGT